MAQKKVYMTPDGAYTKLLNGQQEELVRQWRQWSYYKLRYKDIDG